MWRWEDVRMWRCEDEKIWRWEDVKMRRCEDEKMWSEKMWRWEDVKMRRCEDEKMWRWEGVKMRRCEVRRCEDEKMWRCEDEKMWRWEDEMQTPTIGRTLRSDALGNESPRQASEKPSRPNRTWSQKHLYEMDLRPQCKVSKKYLQLVLAASNPARFCGNVSQGKVGAGIFSPATMWTNGGQCALFLNYKRPSTNESMTCCSCHANCTLLSGFVLSSLHMSGIGSLSYLPMLRCLYESSCGRLLGGSCLKILQAPPSISRCFYDGLVSLVLLGCSKQLLVWRSCKLLYIDLRRRSCCCSCNDIQPHLLLFHSRCCLYLVHCLPTPNTVWGLLPAFFW